jgi:hypothetical protein
MIHRSFRPQLHLKSKMHHIMKMDVVLHAVLITTLEGYSSTAGKKSASIDSIGGCVVPRLGLHLAVKRGS